MELMVRPQMERVKLLLAIDIRFGAVDEILVYYARDCWFYPRTVQTIVCISMSIYIRSECFLCINNVIITIISYCH
jgi:hypothetical protein